MRSTAEAQNETQAALSAAVQSLKLPANVMGQAAQLLSRLERPTRVSLLGLPKSGKTGIFNLLAGQKVLPEGLGSTVQLVHGPAPMAHVTLADGTTMKLEGTPDLERIGAMTPVFVKIELDLPALRKISLLEVVTGNSREEQLRAVKWSVKQTDIGIWCTDDFTANEQALWSGVPDEIKDHAILLRTRADQIEISRQAAVDDLRNALEDNFAFFMAVSSKEAVAARADGALDKAKLKASGATTLISTILRQIERGRQTAVDQADILLMKHAPEGEAAPADTGSAEAKIQDLKDQAEPDASVETAAEPVADVVAPEATPEPVAEVAEPEATPEPVAEVAAPAATPEPVAEVAAPAATPEPVAEVAAPAAAPEPVAEVAEPETTETAPVEVAAEPAEDDAGSGEPVFATKADTARKPASGATADEFAFVSSMSPTTSQSAVPMAALFPVQADETAEATNVDPARKALETALARLRDTGEAIATFEPQDTKKILRASGKTLDWLAVHLSDDDVKGDAEIDALCDMAQDAADLVQLLKAEGGEEGGHDAVTALLQLKRGVQAQLAA